MLPIVHKAAVEQLSVSPSQLRLNIGDPAELSLGESGEVTVSVTRQKRDLLLRRKTRSVKLGLLEAAAAARVTAALRAGEPVRVRIVNISPAHLTADRTESVHVSVWAEESHGARPMTESAASPGRRGPEKATRRIFSRSRIHDGPGG